MKMKAGDIYVYSLKYLTRKSLVKWIILSLIVSRAESVFDSIILRMEQRYVFTKLFFLFTKQIMEVFQLFALYAIGNCLLFLLVVVATELN